MSELNRLYVSNRQDWRKWLEENYQVAKEIWLVYPRIHSGIPRIPYNDAIEEALCFGWIDSITKGIDDDNYSQRFRPFQKNSYSGNEKQWNGFAVSRHILWTFYFLRKPYTAKAAQHVFTNQSRTVTPPHCTRPSNA